jgi:hypothetical protein
MMTPAVTRRAAALVALLAIVGLILEYQTYAAGYSGARLFWRTVDFFSFFTVEANVLVAIVAAASIFAPRSRAAARLAGAPVAGAACLYACVAGATYFFLLRYRHHPTGLALVADNLLHYLVPTAYLALWVGGLPKAGLTLRTLARWMIFPSLYLAYALFRGPRTGFSPYPFIDVAKLGYVGAALNVLALSLAFMGTGAVLVWLSRLVHRRLLPAE